MCGTWTECVGPGLNVWETWAECVGPGLNVWDLG